MHTYTYINAYVQYISYMHTYIHTVNASIIICIIGIHTVHTVRT